jgi:hypothetical protein
MVASRSSRARSRTSTASSLRLRASVLSRRSRLRSRTESISTPSPAPPRGGLARLRRSSRSRGERCGRPILRPPRARTLHSAMVDDGFARVSFAALGRRGGERARSSGREARIEENLASDRAERSQPCPRRVSFAPRANVLGHASPRELSFSPPSSPQLRAPSSQLPFSLRIRLT